MIEIRYGQPLPMEGFRAIHRLGELAYGPGIFTCPGRAEERYLRCPDCFVCAYDGEKMVGEWSTYPVTPDLWPRAKDSPVLLDDDIEASYILPLSREHPNEIMAFDLVVDPAYRGRKLADRLMDGYRAFLRDLMADGYEISRLFGYVITSGGTHMMLKNGARLVRALEDGHSHLFEIDIDRFLAGPFERDQLR